MNVERIGDKEIITNYTTEEWHELRAKDITSTDAAALFGISPYLTAFELWHRKKNQSIVEISENERMKWGTRLQDAIAHGIAEDHGLEVRRKDEYIRRVKLSIGASFDFEFKKGAVKGILEIKNVDSLAFKDGWIVDGPNVEAPPHIELQAQHQMAVSGEEHAWIGPLVGGNRVPLIKRVRDEKIIAALESKISAFWESIKRNEPPQPDFQRDADFISSLYQFASPGKILNAETDPLLTQLALKYKQVSEAAKVLQEEKDGYKAQMLTLIGDAEKVYGEGFSISSGLIGPKEITYTREGYRDFRIFLKKVKSAIAH